MTHTVPNPITVFVVTGAALVTFACGGNDFPVAPTPVANTPVTTLSGGSYSGTILLETGAVTPFNMTLIARALGLTIGQPLPTQAPGTTELTGSFETGTGLKGTIQGNLEGNLQNGLFRGSLTAESPACSREYAGPITESTVAWLPAGSVAPGCPLTFAVQITRGRGPSCQYSVSITNPAVSGNGGTTTVRVTTSENCSWLVESMAPWLQITDPNPKVGNGSVAIRIPANEGGARTGRIQIGGQSLTVSQGQACSYSVAPSSLNTGAGGGEGSVTLTAPDLCEWTVQSDQWITVSPATGVGTRSLSVVVQPNAGSARTGTLRVGGQVVSVTQSGCSVSVSPTEISVAAAGGKGIISVTAGLCSWVASADQPWITVTPSSGQGSGSVAYIVNANFDGPSRVGRILISGQIVTVTQLPPGTGTSDGVGPVVRLD